jgi:hypothetical protein
MLLVILNILIISNIYRDVDSNLPPGAGARKGMAVRRIRINASWVKFSPIQIKEK